MNAPDAICWRPDIETAEPGDLRRMQEERLRRQLAYLTERSPFYRRKLGEAGIAAADVRTVDDLAGVPFTAKSELRESQLATPPLGDHAAADYEQVVRVHASSGTTGRPSYVGVTRRDAESWTEIVSRVFYCEDVRRNDVVVHALGLGFFVGGLPLKDGIENIGATFVPIGTGASDRVVASIRHLGGTVLTCTPSYASYLADYARSKAEIDPRELGLRRILVGGEPGGGIPSVRERIERDFGAVVLESLGNADIAPVYAATCEHQGGNHLIAPDQLLLELIDPESGEQLAWEDGAEGELVATHLTRECVPLLRFRTRDRVVVGTGACGCGRTSPRVRCIGRTDDLLIVNGVNIWPSAIRDVVAGLSPRTTGNFEVLLSQPPPSIQPPLRLRVERGDARADETLKEDLEKTLREKLIARSEIELVAPGTLPRYEMKANVFRRLDLLEQEGDRG